MAKTSNAELFEGDAEKTLQTPRGKKKKKVHGHKEVANPLKVDN